MGALSYLAGSTGNSFAITAIRTFGKFGYKIVSGLLATVVIGWFALMVGLTGDTMFHSFGQNLLLMTILGGVLYVGATFIGIKALSILGYIAAPMYLILGVISIWMAFDKGTSDIFSYEPTVTTGLMSFGAAITLVFATFADSGTMTADFTRWAKNGKEGFLAAFTAFPFAKFLAEGIGAIIVATGVIQDPFSTGGDFIGILSGHNALLSAIVIVFVFINLGVGCTHCLYNGAVGWSHIIGGKMRTLTIALGIVGIIAAVSGIWNAFQDWLNLLGLIVPPIATIIIMDQMVLNRKYSDDMIVSRDWKPMAFIVWAMAGSCALIVNFNAPHLSVVLTGIISSAVFYLIGNAIVKPEMTSECLKNESDTTTVKQKTA